MVIGKEINHLNQIVIDAFRNKSLCGTGLAESPWLMSVAIMIDELGQREASVCSPKAPREIASCPWNFIKAFSPAQSSGIHS